MTAQLGVTAPADAAVAAVVRQVVASLPVSLRLTEVGGDLLAVAGTPGWGRAAADALRPGVRGVVVVDPVPEDADELRERAQAAGVPVVVDATWTHAPAVADSAEAFHAVDGPDSLVECRVDVPPGADLDRVLLAQLALVRAAVGPVERLVLVRRDDSGYDALADLASGARGSLGAVVSGALPHAASLRVVRPHAAVSLRVPGPATAVPGAVVVSGEQGATLLPTRWETASRAAWRHLHSLVETGGTCADLDGLARDVALLRSARQSARQTPGPA